MIHEDEEEWEVPEVDNGVKVSTETTSGLSYTPHPQVFYCCHNLVPDIKSIMDLYELPEFHSRARALKSRLFIVLQAVPKTTPLFPVQTLDSGLPILLQSLGSPPKTIGRESRSGNKHNVWESAIVWKNKTATFILDSSCYYRNVLLPGL